jgi:hypothetical protein
MQTVGLVLSILGILLYAGGLFDLLVTAFKRGVWWGLGVLLVSPVAIVFALMHWGQAARPCLALVGGCLLIALGFALIYGAA